MLRGLFVLGNDPSVEVDFREFEENVRPRIPVGLDALSVDEALYVFDEELRAFADIDPSFRARERLADGRAQEEIARTAVADLENGVDGKHGASVVSFKEVIEKAYETAVHLSITDIARYERPACAVDGDEDFDPAIAAGSPGIGILDIIATHDFPRFEHGRELLLTGLHRVFRSRNHLGHEHGTTIFIDDVRALNGFRSFLYGLGHFLYGLGYFRRRRR